MKKFISIILVVILALSFTPVFAENDQMSSGNIQLILGKLGIMNGYPDGNFYPERSVTRAEFAKIAIMASTYRNYVASGMNTSPFADVPYTHWAAPYVKLASVNKIITGYPDSTFRPESSVLMEEAVTVAVKMLGYSDDDFAASWPYGQIGVAKNNGILDNISAQQGTYLTRGDVAQLIYNTLTAKPKSSSQADAKYMTSVGYSLLENVTVLATAAEDSGVGTGKVSTSSGTFKINSDFDRTCIGRKGYVLLNDSNEMLLFIDDNLRTVDYSVYSVLENEIVAYKDGSLVSLKLSDNLTAYHDLKATTLGALKASIDTGYKLTVAYDSLGNPDYVTVNENELIGPIVVLGSFEPSSYNLSTSPTVMRDGNKSSLSGISRYDVVYYSNALDTVWAYSKKVTGTYESAAPSRDSVSSVTIAGKSYNIESAEASIALSSSGDFVLGDTVTVLLGKDGEVAGVISPGNVSSIVYGFVTAAGTSEFTDSDGNITSSRYIQLVHTDGSTVKYKTNNNYSSLLHSTVKLTLSNGIATARSENEASSINGVVDSKKLTLGKHSLSESVNILEVTTVEASEALSFTTLFLNRLDGMNIKSSQVLFYDKDAKGNISDLILLNATGDAYKYGIITNVSSMGSSGSGGSYSGFMGTDAVNISSQNTKYSVTAGQPVQFTMSGNSVRSITALSQINDKIKSASIAYVETDKQTYKISDNCVVYNAQNNVININDAFNDSSLKLQFYIDKHSSTVRIIKALKK